MKVASLLKNCIIYNLGPNVVGWFNSVIDGPSDDLPLETFKTSLEKLTVKEPTGQQWSSNGFTAFPSQEYFYELNGSLMLMVQVNERNLPARVRDERVAALAADLEERQQRKVGKKEYAELREQAEQELLPQAFIKRAYVPILLMPHGDKLRMFVFTSSHKRADTVIAVLAGLLQNCGTELQGASLSVQNGVEGALTTLADESYESEEDDDFEFQAGSYAKLVASNPDSKKTVTVKDKDIYSQEVRDLIKAGDYRVRELGVELLEDFAERSSFVITSKFDIKKLVFGDVIAPSVKEAGADFYAYAFLIVRELEVILDNFLPFFGGERDFEFPESGMAAAPSFTEEAKQKTSQPEPDLGASDDDDEL